MVTNKNIDNDNHSHYYILSTIDNISNTNMTNIDTKKLQQKSIKKFAKIIQRG